MNLQIIYYKILYYIFKFLRNISFGNLKKTIVSKRDLYEKKSLPEIVNYEFCREKGLKNKKKKNSPELEILLNSQILNKIKEQNLREKVQKGKKINVCFIVTYISKLYFHSVYESMLKSKLFNPFIVLYDAQENYFLEWGDDYEWNEHKKSFEFLKNKGYVVYDGFDEDKNIIPIETFKPDIVFSADINLDFIRNHLSNISLNINYLTCYLNYSLNTVNNYNYHYNNRGVATGWKMFVESRQDYYELTKFSKYCGTNTVLVGYPKLDSFAKPIEDCKIPEKLNNGKPIVIFAPHFSIKIKDEYRNMATFHLYYKYFLNLVKNNPDINFVFKPHPELRHRLHWLKIMTMNEFDEYTKEWDSLPNGKYIFDGDYIDLFRKSDLLIQDCGSFIGEWLPTDKPCMFLINPERKQRTYMQTFSIIGRKILDKYYLCHNLEEIDRYFKMIMCDKQDPLREERIKLKDEVFINLGCAGQKIVDYLTEILTN